MYQPYPSGGRPAEPPRLAAPAPVRTAIKLMYASAAISTVPLIITLASIGDTNGYHLRWNGHSLTAAQISHWRPLIITAAVVGGLVVPAVWLWMARANGRGRNWARIVSTVLFGAATLDLTGAFGPPGFRLSLAPTVFGPTITVLYWLVGLAVVWLLWRPASRGYFRPPGVTLAQHRALMAEHDHQAQMAELDRIRSSRAQRIRSSRAQMPRHV